MRPETEADVAKYVKYKADTNEITDLNGNVIKPFKKYVEFGGMMDHIYLGEHLFDYKHIRLFLLTCHWNEIRRSGKNVVPFTHKEATHPLPAGITHDRGKWMARIQRDGKRVNLGRFDSKEEAIAAREAARATHP
jgi:hypothetical protein